MSNLKNNEVLVAKIEAKISEQEASTKALKTELKSVKAKTEDCSNGEMLDILEKINPAAAAKSMRALLKKA